MGRAQGIWESMGNQVMVNVRITDWRATDNGSLILFLNNGVEGAVSITPPLTLEDGTVRSSSEMSDALADILAAASVELRQKAIEVAEAEAERRRQEDEAAG